MFYKKYIEDVIYFRDFWLILGDTEKANEFIKELKFTKSINDDVNGVMISMHGTTCLYIEEPSKNLDTVIHEIVHLAIWNFKTIGLPITHNNSEAFAYYVQYLYNLINKFISQKYEKLQPTSTKLHKRITRVQPVSKRPQHSSK